MIPLLLHLVIFVVFQYAPQHLATTCHAPRNMTSCFNVRAGFAPEPLLVPVNLTKLWLIALSTYSSFASCLSLFLVWSC